MSGNAQRQLVVGLNPMDGSDPVAGALHDAGLPVDGRVPVHPVRVDGLSTARAVAQARSVLGVPGVEAVVLTDEPRVGEVGAAVVFARSGGRTWPRVYAEVLGAAVTDGEPSFSVSGAATEALRDTGLEPVGVDYLDVGTPGPGELAALGRVYTAIAGGRLGCLLGAVPGGGLGQLAAVARNMYEAWLPAPPPGLDRVAVESLLGDSVFAVAAGGQPWLVRASGGRRVAALTGTTAAAAAHVLIADVSTSAGTTPVAWPAVAGAPLLLTVSAGAGEGLADAAVTLRRRLESGIDPVTVMRETVGTQPRGRYRAVFVGSDTAGLVRELAAGERDLPGVIRTEREWATPAGSYCAGRPLPARGKVAFVYPGTYATYPSAGHDVFRLFPGLRARYEAETPRPVERFGTHRVFPRGLTAWDAAARARHARELVEDAGVMLTSGVTFALLHTWLLRDVLGVQPDGGLGYSLGEISMLFSHDVWSAERADDVAIRDTPLFRHELHGRRTVARAVWSLPDEVPDEQVWATHVLLTDVRHAATSLAGLDRVFVTHVNTPGELVVAGDPEQCAELARRLGCPSVELPAAPVLHCPLVDPVLDRLVALNDHPRGAPDPALQLLTAYDFDPYPIRDLADVGRHVGEILRGRIDFVELVRAAHARGFRYFVEVGPGAACTRWIGETLGGAEYVAVSVDRQGTSGAIALAQALARLIGSGLDVDLAILLPARPVAHLVAVDPALPRPAAEPVAAAGAPSSTSPSEVGTSVSDEVPMSIPLAADEELITVVGEPFPGVVPPESVQRAPAVPFVTPAPPAVATSVPRPVLAHSSVRPTGVLAGVGASVAAIGAVVAQAHRSALRAQAAVLEHALRTVEGPRAQPPGGPHIPSTTPGTPLPPSAFRPRPPLPAAPPDAQHPPGGRDGSVIWGYGDLVEFANGSVAKVFGPEFAAVDGRTRRVRLPSPPYLFVSRVTRLDACTGVYEPCSISVEYDVPEDSWFSVDGRAPFAVIFEVGQCSLLLLSYLGIDLDNPDDRAYRLLDGSAIFYGRLPKGGQTLRYDISIDRFVWTDGKLLLFFSYRCYHGDDFVLEMVDGCAGFFTRHELEDSLGIVDATFGMPRETEVPRRRFTPLARTDRTALGRQDLELLAEGCPGEVFGQAWDQRADGSNPSVRLPSGAMLFLDEVTMIDRLGGPAGLGELTAIKHVTADDWYFRCHFSDDPVLPGSLIIEGAAQLLQVYAIYLGLHLVLPDAELQPVPGLRADVKVRGQLTPGERNLRYVARVTSISLIDRPTLIADIAAYDGDKQVTSVMNFGIQLREKPGTAYRPELGGRPSTFLGRRNSAGEPALVNELHLAHLTRGDLGTAMGPEFDIYRDRRAPHIPGGDFQFLDRIMSLTGKRGGTDTDGSVMVSEYDSPADAWYYEDNNAFPNMPNCVLMETSLQAAVMTGYYLGATLVNPDQEMTIRNLDGKAGLVKNVDLRGRTIRHRSEVLSTQHLAGVSLQGFRYELSADGEVFYRGESLFGYFNEAALANQTGLDGGEYVAPWLDRQVDLDPARVQRFEVAGDDRWIRPQPGSGLKLAGRQLRLVDKVDVVRDGGDHGRGYLRGRRRIDPDDWYFACHFFQDPVMPGSLGVEAVLQGLQAYIIRSGIAEGMGPMSFALPTALPTEWKYRGQILPTDGEMVFDLHVKEIRRAADGLTVITDANVWKPGMRIYELIDLAIEVRRDGADDGAATKES